MICWGIDTSWTDFIERIPNNLRLKLHTNWEYYVKGYYYALNRNPVKETKSSTKWFNNMLVKEYKSDKKGIHIQIMNNYSNRITLKYLCDAINKKRKYIPWGLVLMDIPFLTQSMYLECTADYLDSFNALNLHYNKIMKYVAI